MDYKTIMDSSNVKFSDVYENNIVDIQGDYLSIEVCEKLKEKRIAGLKKYGEYSFQNSFEQTMSSPTLEHAEEEILDAINYIAHEIFKRRFLCNSNIMELENILGNLSSILGSIRNINEISRIADAH